MRRIFYSLLTLIFLAAGCDRSRLTIVENSQELSEVLIYKIYYKYLETYKLKETKRVNLHIVSYNHLQKIINDGDSIVGLCQYGFIYDDIYICERESYITFIHELTHVYFGPSEEKAYGREKEFSPILEKLLEEEFQSEEVQMH